jgi:hypothetical protein
MKLKIIEEGKNMFKKKKWLFLSNHSAFVNLDLLMHLHHENRKVVIIYSNGNKHEFMYDKHAQATFDFLEIQRVLQERDGFHYIDGNENKDAQLD